MKQNPQIQKAKLGNQIAFTNLYDLHKKYVYNYILNRTKDINLANEITNETFTKAFIRINTYNPQYNFKTWLITIARNTHCDLIKKKSPIYFDISDNYFHIADSTHTPEEKLIVLENEVLLIKTFKKLKPNFQEILMLLNEGMSYEEIANKTGDSLGNIRTKICRARTDLNLLLYKTAFN